MKMNIEWLEPSLEKRINAIIDAYLINSNSNETQIKFMIMLSNLNDGFISNPKLLELEGLFHSNLALSIEYSYRAGFEDAIKLKNY